MRFFRHPLLKIFYWIVAEVILNIIGFDDLADYSEFILNKRVVFSEVMIVEQRNDIHRLVGSIPTIPTHSFSQSIEL
ncbi:MAG: hypothetical protein WBA13_05090 [Microcoleaceae cyanobacterium]